MTNIKGLGATNNFPDGKVNDDDEGELQLAVGFDPNTKMVKIEFGKPVHWLMMKPEDAIALGQVLIRHGQRGITHSKIII